MFLSGVCLKVEIHSLELCTRRLPHIFANSWCFLIFFFEFPGLVGVQWHGNHNVVLICIGLVTNVVE